LGGGEWDTAASDDEGAVAVETGDDGIWSMDWADHGADDLFGAFPGFHFDPAALAWFLSGVGSFNDESFDSDASVHYLGLRGPVPARAVERMWGT